MTKKVLFAAWIFSVYGICGEVLFAQPKPPAPSEKELEEFFTAFFDELAKEIEKEEGKKAPPSPARTPTSTPQQREKKAHDEQKTLAQLFEEPITLEKNQKLQDVALSSKKEKAFEKYMGELYDAVLQLNRAIVALDLHKKQKIGSDIGITHQLAADIAQLADPHVPVYRAALYLPGFTTLRRKIMRLTKALSVIGMDITPPAQPLDEQELTKLERPDVSRDAPTFTPREKKNRRSLSGEAQRHRAHKKEAQKKSISPKEVSSPSWWSRMFSYVTAPFKKLYEILGGAPSKQHLSKPKKAAKQTSPTKKHSPDKTTTAQGSNLFTNALEHFARLQSGGRAPGKIPPRHKQALWELVSLLQGELKTLHDEFTAVAQKADEPLKQIKEERAKQEEQAQREAARRERISKQRSASRPSYGPQFGGSPYSRPPQYQPQRRAGRPFAPARFGGGEFRPPIPRQRAAFGNTPSTQRPSTKAPLATDKPAKEQKPVRGRMLQTDNMLAEHNLKKRIIREVDELIKKPHDQGDHIKKVQRLLDDLEEIEVKLPESRTKQKSWQDLDASFQHARNAFNEIVAQQKPQENSADDQTDSSSATQTSYPQVRQPLAQPQQASSESLVASYLTTDQDAKLSALKHLLRHIQQAPAFNTAPQTRAHIEQLLRMQTWKRARAQGISYDTWRDQVASALSIIGRDMKQNNFSRWDLVDNLANTLQEDGEISPELQSYNTQLRKGRGMRIPSVSVQQYIEPAQQLLTSLTATNQPNEP